MPSRCTQLKLKNMQRRYDELCAEASQLLSTRSTVCRRLVLLESLCDCFAVYKGRTKEAAPEDSSWPADVNELLQHEQQLLSELQQFQSGTWDPLDVPSLGVVTIAPRTDPLAFFKHHLAQAPNQTVSNLTALDVAGEACLLLLCCTHVHPCTCTAWWPVAAAASELKHRKQSQGIRFHVGLTVGAACIVHGTR